VPDTITRTFPDDSAATQLWCSSFRYPGTDSQIYLPFQVTLDPLTGVRSIYAVRDIAAHFFIGTLDTNTTVFQPKRINGLRLRTPDGKYLLAQNTTGLHHVNPAGDFFPPDVFTTTTTFLPRPAMANVRIVYDKNICAGTHPAIYTTRYVHAGERLMANVSADCLSAFVKDYKIVIRAGMSPGTLNRDGAGAVRSKTHTFIDNDPGNPFHVVPKLLRQSVPAV